MSETSQQDFLTWAQDPERTLERFGILRLAEHVYHCHYRGADKPVYNYDKKRREREIRKFDPSYNPVLAPHLLEWIAPIFPTLKSLHLHAFGEDRPTRDLSFLAFLPALESLHIDSLDVEDLAPLRHLTALTDLQVNGSIADISAISACISLRRLYLLSGNPWPLVDGFETLPHLEEIHWLAPPQAFTLIPALPALRSLHIGFTYYERNTSVSLRDFGQMPEMPMLERLYAGSFYRLDGISRYPRLRFATLHGYFKTLAPLAGLPQLTHLRVASNSICEIASATALPSLFHISVYGERPHDWTALMDCGNLREAHHFGCETPEPELGTLLMVLPGHDDVFAAPAPRPLPPLRLIVHGDREDKIHIPCPVDTAYPAGPEGWHGNPGMIESEQLWAAILLKDTFHHHALHTLQGLRCEAKQPTVYEHFSRHSPYSHPHRCLSIRILRTEAIGRLREILEAARTALATTRFPWAVHIILDAEPDADTWDDDWRGKLTPEEEARLEEEDHLYYVRKEKRRHNLLADEQRLQTQRELGLGDDTFTPTPLVPLTGDETPAPFPEKGKNDTGKKSGDKKSDDDGEGGTAELEPGQEPADEQWLPEPEISDPNSFWHDLTTIFLLNEQGIWFNGHYSGLDSISYLLSLLPERYQPDPEPPA